MSGKLQWTFGIVKVRIAKDQNIGHQAARTDRDLRKGVWREYIGWAAGPFTIHRVESFPRGVHLSHRETGCMISRSPSIHRMFRLAEELADLDWSGPVEDFRERNRAAVIEAERKVREEHTP